MRQNKRRDRLHGLPLRYLSTKKEASAAATVEALGNTLIQHDLARPPYHQDDPIVMNKIENEPAKGNDEPTKTYFDVRGRAIRLTRERHGHIRECHPRLAALQRKALSKGRAKNRLSASADAVGAHSTFARDRDGNVYKYQTYRRTRVGHFDPTKRFDGGTAEGRPGVPHRNKKTLERIPTPHVQGKKVPGGVRRPLPDEFPNNRRFENERS